jgi:hypothetical protein
LALLRGQLPSTLLREYWAYARNGAPSDLATEGTSDYTALMAGSQALVAGEILAAHDLGSYRCLLDVGGGNGQFLRSALTATPGLQAMLFDLPTVAHSSRAHFDAAGLSGRVQITGGDFFRDPLPKGADLVTLVRVLHDHDDERTWRHLDSCNFQTILHARVPRVNCPTHGVRQARVPWAEPRSRFTSLFERFAIDVLLETNVAGAAKILGVSWDEAQHIMERAVARGEQRRPHEVPRVMGVDEKALAKGQRYATLAYDLEAGHVIGIAEGRSGDSLVACLGRFSLNDLAGVEAVAMDMSAAYVQRVRAIVADADQKIVFDRFHIAAHMNKAVDQVRRGENKVLRLDGDERVDGNRLGLWLKACERAQ